MFTIRPARPDDAETLVELIKGLAEYERLLHEAQPDAETLRAHLAGTDGSHCEALMAETADGRAAGFALYFANYSTFLTRWGIYLEDIFVLPEHRGRGLGFALLKRVAEIAVERGCQRMDWNVLDWNEPAIGFYEKLGARMMKDWRLMRLTGDALHRLGTPDGP